MKSENILPNPRETEAIRRDQVRYLYEGALSPLTANILITVILAGIVWDVISHSVILKWIFIQAVITSGRIFIFLSYGRTSKADDRKWLIRFRAGMAASSLGWTISCIMMFPPNDIPHQAFMSLAFAGLTAGVITSMSIDFISVLLFSIPLMGTLGLRLFIEGGELSFAMGLMVIIYLVLTSLIGRRTNLAFKENILLRLNGILREEILSRSEAKFRTLYNSTSDAVMLLTEKGFFDCNTATLSMFGCLTIEEFCNCRPKDLSPPEQPGGANSLLLANQHIEKALEEGSLRFEWIHRRVDSGKTFPAEVLLSSLILDGKRVLQAVVRDISGRKQMEQLLQKQENEFRSLAESSPDNIIRYDKECRAVYANHAMGKTVNVSPYSLIGKKPSENQNSGITGIENYENILRKVISTGERDQVEISLLNPAGDLRTHHIFFVAETDNTGKIIGALAFGRDITDLKQHEALEETRLRVFEKLANNEPLHQILDLVASQTEKFRPGLLVSIMLIDSDGKHLKVVSAPHLPEEYCKAIDGLEIGNGNGSCGTAVWRGETVIVDDVRSHPYWINYRELAARFDLVSCWSEPIYDSIGKILGAFAIYRREPGHPGHTDLKLMKEAGYIAAIAIERKQAEQTIHNLAFFDPLTRLPNRRLLQDRLKQALAASERNRHHGAILFIDLDKFKNLNDTQGHEKGDQLLIQTAQRLQECVRSDDTVSRLGGDEFVIILNNLHPEKEWGILQAEILAEKIRIVINRPFSLGGFEYHSSPSIGIALFFGKTNSQDELLKQADTAMYQAKRSGRNTLRFFDPETHAAMEVNIAFEKELGLALAKNQFKLFFQIQVNHNDHISGAEVLLRWEHPERGYILPVQFIPLAEETGLIVPIGYWVLEAACRQLKSWEMDARLGLLQLAVNISAKQFRQNDFVGRVTGIIKKTGINPEKLKLELTESVLLEDIDETIQRMKELKDLGVHFSMDDFGTGYSSLSYLSRLPLNQLKIDKSFVQNMSISTTDALIVQTIIGLGKILLLDVIAEGVETIEQRDLLKEHGCLSWQGHFFGKPVSGTEFEKMFLQ
ncbi:MAG: EAL domain-containing protein [Spirochaetia bacterium]|nr:EAL domain-containing protein [Spirochaetia bacterium]